MTNSCTNYTNNIPIFLMSTGETADGWRRQLPAVPAPLRRTGRSRCAGCRPVGSSIAAGRATATPYLFHTNCAKRLMNGCRRS